jgi:large conductance mechanosensitive channel
MQGFKQFLMRGNVVDMAVGVVVGVAFGAVVAALVKDLITSLIAAIVGKPTPWSRLSWSQRRSILLLCSQLTP